MRSYIAPAIRITTIANAATRASTMAMLHQSPRFVYKLGNSLYVPLTSQCNSLTLPQSRGDEFHLPTSVVAALCRVRDVELRNFDVTTEEERVGETKWYLNDDGKDLPPKMKLPPPQFEALPSISPRDGALYREREPKLSDLLHDIRRELTIPTRQSIDAIVIAGEGEPTLRLEDTIELVQRIRSLTSTILDSTSPVRMPPAIRLTTNGLVIRESSPISIPQKLWDCGISRISVALMTWDAKQYYELMKPVMNESSKSGFDTVCDFIKDAVAVEGDLEVEITAVDRLDVDKSKTEALAESLGVTKSVRWRPYFP